MNTTPVAVPDFPAFSGDVLDEEIEALIEYPFDATDDNVVVVPEKPPERVGKIIVEQAAVPVGIVVSVGEEAFDCERGDRVLYRPYAGIALKIDGEEVRVLKSQDILLLLEHDAQVENL